MSLQATVAAGERLKSFGNLELAVPVCAKGIGTLIGRPDSPDLIEGVRVQQLAVYPDDRGYFLEVQRMGQGLAAHFPAETSQVAAAMNYPGTVKAFHFHMHQTDCWNQQAKKPKPANQLPRLLQSPTINPDTNRNQNQ